MERRLLLSTYVVTSPADGGSGNTLRWAIQQVDADFQPDRIEFNIAGGGVQSIQLTSPLPTLTNSVFIDGSTETGYAGTPLIQIDGSKLGSGSNGLALSAGNSTVLGLSIVHFPGSAIVLSSQGGNVISSDYLGVVAAGTQAGANGTGISIDGSSNNTIGISSVGIGNVISGNSGNGITIQTTGSSADGNEVVGNLIGTSPSGLVALPNTLCGIQVNGARGTQIGQAAVNSGNVVSGNAGPGITLMAGTSLTLIQNNAVGVAADWKTPLANGSDGILLSDAPNTQIGGTGQFQTNVIGSNHGNGIDAQTGSSGLIVENNFIGTDVTATVSLGNQADGVFLACSSNTIGGTIAGAGNTIDFNGVGQPGSGVELTTKAVQNEILSNSIYKNSDLGINFGSGPTQNHTPGSPGPNNYQNYPTLSLAASDGSVTTINGTLNSLPNTNFLVQFFSSPAETLSGFGEGKLLIGSQTVPTDAQGNATFSVPLPSGTTPGQYISATATDPMGNTSEFALDVQTQGQIDLRITGSANPSPVLAGGELTYAIVVANQGTIAAQQVMVLDNLPGAVKLVSAAVSQGFVQPSMGSTIRASFDTIAPGGSATLTIVVETSASSVGTITDTASVTSQQTDPTPGDETTTVTTTVLADSDLALTMTASPNPVLAGSTLTYTMTVSNFGPDDASSVKVKLPLGAGVNFVSATPSIGQASFNNGEVDITIDDLPANTPAAVQVVVQPMIAGSLSVTGTVSSASLDPVSSNNTATATVVVNPSADLGVTIAASTRPAAPNIPFQYTVTATNAGPSGGTNVVVSDTLPLGVTFKSASSDQGITPTFLDGVVSMTIPNFNAGATANMTIVVDPAGPPGSSLTDLASVQGVEPDPSAANNSAELVIAVKGVSDLGAAVVAQPSVVDVGQNIRYTLTVTNQGPNDEPDASVSCPIPPDATFVSAIASQGDTATYGDGLLTVDLEALASGATAQVTFVLTPLAAAAGQFTANFSVEGENLDPALTNNSAQATVQVNPASDLAVSILPGHSAPADQADWTYTVVVTNLGLSDAVGVIASTAALPANVELVSESSSQGKSSVGPDGAVTATLGTIFAGQSATLTMTVMPTSDAPIPLQAEVQGGEDDPDPGNNQTSLIESVSPSVNLTIALLPESPVALTGRNWTFTAAITNTGPDPATNVVFSLPLVSNFVCNSSDATQGTTSLNGTQLAANLGSLAPGATAHVTVVIMASLPGVVTQTATVSSSDNQLDAANSTTSMTVTVQESAGNLQFAAPGFAVSELAGYAPIIVTRTDGTKGAVTVNYQTNAVNATPGLDFDPTSGTLSLADGQSSATFYVPVLADRWDNHDEYVNISLNSPGGGAMVGNPATTLLRIIDVDPNFTPPQVSGLSWSGSSRSITSLNVSFTAPLNPLYAMISTNYQLVAPALGNAVITLIPRAYNPASESITLVPSVPLPSGVYYHLQLVGTGPTAIRDVAGNLLDGSGAGVPGSNYVASFAQGTRLQYLDGTGNHVTLKLTGGGYMEQVLDANNEGQVLNVVGEVPHRTTLAGSVKATTITKARKIRVKNGTTSLGTLSGLGNFGDVRVTLTAPPFLVKQFPFQRKGHGVL
jgi:uncharacterized repeat protein (TIGR01451 family)